MDIGWGFSEGDAVVVTGFGSGIGRATAVLAASAGLQVIGWDIDGAAGAATVDQIVDGGGTATAVVCDVGDPMAVEAAMIQAVEGGVPRFLVNNAGPESRSGLGFDEALVLAVGSVNRVTEMWAAAGPPPGAAVVNVSSIAGNVLGAEPGWYAAAKSGIAGLTRTLAVRHGGRIRVNAVGPGLVDTPRMEQFVASPLGRQMAERNPMGRIAVPDDVAPVILFLLSPAARYVNAALVPVDGGYTAVS